MPFVGYVTDGGGRAAPYFSGCGPSLVPRPRPRQGHVLEDILAIWGRLLVGDVPALSIEITRECPLRCPGCYAYGDDHLGGGITLREVRDLKGQELVDAVLALVDRHRPLHLSIVGGEPLVRYRELDVLLPI